MMLYEQAASNGGKCELWRWVIEKGGGNRSRWEIFPSAPGWAVRSTMLSEPDDSTS